MDMETAMRVDLYFLPFLTLPCELHKKTDDVLYLKRTDVCTSVFILSRNFHCVPPSHHHAGVLLLFSQHGGWCFESGQGDTVSAVVVVYVRPLMEERENAFLCTFYNKAVDKHFQADAVVSMWAGSAALLSLWGPGILQTHFAGHHFKKGKLWLKVRVEEKLRAYLCRFLSAADGWMDNRSLC